METRIQEIPVTEIRAGNNDRKNFERVSLLELADSIRESGLAQPITVRPIEAGFEIVAGERRFRAISELLKWDTIPAIVRELNDEEASAIMLVENTGRADLNPIEEANAYQERVTRFGWTPEVIAEKAGKSIQTVKSRLALLSLRWDVQELVKMGDLPIGHANLMVALDHNRQGIALRIMETGGNPSIRIFRGIVARLSEEQDQDSLFDLETFYVEEMGKLAQDTPRGKSAKIDVPTRNDLPKPQGTGTAAQAIANYIKTLEESGFLTEAATIGTLYASLVKTNLMKKAE